MPSIIKRNITTPGDTTTPLTPVMVDTVKAFRLTLDNAAPGQKIIYYTGHLLYDRDDKSKYPSVRVKIRQLADAVYDAGLVGKCYLLQRRLGDYKWDYYCVVARH